jgi:predicted short-subunit dehydrogenase-like oxidoreductase (DUF2520 family)
MRADWKGRVVLHSSGVLGSDVLKALRDRGARTASAHPFMTFVKLSRSDLKNVPFALEGENKALSVVGAIVRSLGARPFRMPLRLKPAYHAFGFFSSPAIVALMVAAQRVGKLAGLSQNRGRELMSPIVRETIENCLRTDPRAAFSGPMRRGDVATVRKHLAVLKQDPALLQVYRALGGIALEELPVANSGELRKILTTGPPYRLR